VEPHLVQRWPSRARTAARKRFWAAPSRSLDHLALRGRPCFAQGCSRSTSSGQPGVEQTFQLTGPGGLRGRCTRRGRRGRGARVRSTGGRSVRGCEAILRRRVTSCPFPRARSTPRPYACAPTTQRGRMFRPCGLWDEGEAWEEASRSKRSWRCRRELSEADAFVHRHAVASEKAQEVVNAPGRGPPTDAATLGFVAGNRHTRTVEQINDPSELARVVAHGCGCSHSRLRSSISSNSRSASTL
jgi:hypothetical protein